MSKIPPPVALISCFFILAGTVGILYHASELKDFATQPEIIWLLVVRLLAIVAGVFALFGTNAARWLMIAWIAYHAVLSIFHTTSELIMHTVLLILVIVTLFYPKANAYFQKEK